MKSVNVLFITFNNIDDTKFGGGQCSRQNYLSLNEFAVVDIYTISKKSPFKSALSLLSLLFPPISSADVLNVRALIESADKKYNYIFFDSSLLGRVLKSVKKIYNIPALVFFHNVEVDYISVRFGNHILKYPYLLLAWLSERMSIKYSDRLIVLNERDSNRLFKLYKRSADDVISINLSDEMKGKELSAFKNNGDKYCLFMGSFRRANYEGIKWFIENVAVHIQGKLLIVGNGFEEKREELCRTNVEVIGRVDDIAPYYLKASCIVSPIFIGGGMKVKTAEALMYGKTVFASSEAFEGYDIDYDKVGGLCNTAEEFIEKINRHFTLSTDNYNSYSRQVFLDRYSTSAVLTKYEHLLKIVNKA